MISNIPDVRAGFVPAITIATPDLHASLEFYLKLGFVEVQRFQFPFPWIQITDGALLIMLRKDETPYIALTYYVDQAILSDVVAAYENAGIVFTSKPGAGDMVPRYMFMTPDGLPVSLVANMADFFTRPTGTPMLRMPQEDYFKPERYTNKTIGMFGELAIPVADLEASISFWQLLGFVVTYKMDRGYPWCIITDGDMVLGLHQTTDFSYPAITYFAADMKEKIAALVAGGLEQYRQKGNDANVVVTTPEQQHIFLFKL